MSGLGLSSVSGVLCLVDAAAIVVVVVFVVVAGIGVLVVF